MRTQPRVDAPGSDLGSAHVDDVGAVLREITPARHHPCRQRDPILQGIEHDPRRSCQRGDRRRGLHPRGRDGRRGGLADARRSWSCLPRASGDDQAGDDDHPQQHRRGPAGSSRRAGIDRPAGSADPFDRHAEGGRSVGDLGLDRGQSAVESGEDLNLFGGRHQSSSSCSRRTETARLTSDRTPDSEMPRIDAISASVRSRW